MRKIEFRGKIDGKWYVASPDNYIRWKQFWASVDRETVGEYIGTEDKHRNKICEGDLCKVDGGMVYLRGTGMVEGTYEVYWNDDRWGLREHGGNSDYDNGDYYRGDDITWNKATVIGNIYDDLEAMKREGTKE